jgi:hypothetical protein
MTHGTLTGYINHYCRCGLCCSAHSKYQAMRYQLRKRGKVKLDAVRLFVWLGQQLRASK